MDAKGKIPILKAELTEQDNQKPIILNFEKHNRQYNISPTKSKKIKNY